MNDAKDKVKELTQKHSETWADKPQWFWLISLVEEVAELALSLVGLHKDPPEFELAQIASIAINWRKHRLTSQCTRIATFPQSQPPQGSKKSGNSG